MKSKTRFLLSLWLGLCLSGLLLLACVAVTPPVVRDAGRPLTGEAMGFPDYTLRPWCDDDSFPDSELVFMKLVQRQPNGSLGPGLALTWQSNAAHTEWTFQIDPQAVFHDGTPITAQAVKAAFEVGYRSEMQCAEGGLQRVALANVIGSPNALANATAASYPDLLGIIAQPNYQAAYHHRQDQERYTLLFRLTTPDPNFPGALAGEFAGVFKAKQLKNDPAGWLRNPTGSGPYKAVGMDAGGTAYRLLPAETWWRARPAMDAVETSDHVESTSH